MPGVELLVAVAAAVALLAVGFVAGARTGARLVVRRALSAPAPEVRQAAVRLAAHTGLAPHLKALVGRTRVEHDRRVLATLADAVSATVPGPDDPPLLDELRLWARSYTDTRPSPSPGGGGGGGRNRSSVLPVVLCTVAAVAGAVVGAGLGGSTLALAGSAVFAGVVLVAYLASMTAGRSGSAAPPAPRAAAPVPPKEPAAFDTLGQPAPGDDVIDLRSAERGRVEAPTERRRSAGEAFWDVSAPDDEVKELLERRDRPPPGGRRSATRRRGGRQQQ